MLRYSYLPPPLRGGPHPEEEHMEPTWVQLGLAMGMGEGMVLLVVELTGSDMGLPRMGSME